ncbi:trigger factor [Gemmatimonadetes bacterium T265]|nr:trigger factor [Gemmatimonadetes bacterium T265]
MDIQITPKESAGVERHLDVSIPPEAVAAAEDKTARRYTSQARLPGFRPGKAPAGLVRKRFANEIRQETLQGLVQDAYQQLVEQEKLDFVTQPHIHDLKFEPGTPLTFTFHVEVRPEVTLDRVEGFEVERGATEVTDAMLTQQLDQMREQRAAWVPVEEAPQSGDRVTLDLSVQENEPGEGEAVEMSEPQQFDVVVGQGQAIPAVESLITRTAPGQTTEDAVTWPDDFPVESERGKSKRVRVHVKEVKRKQPPVLDDAFAREVGDFDSLDALTTAVRGDLGAQLVRDVDAEVRSKLLDQIIEANPFDVPPSWVANLANGYAEAYQIPEKDRAQFAQQFRPLAERQVRRDVVVDALAKAHGLQASAADVDAEIETLARARNQEPGQFYAAMQKANRLNEIEHGLTERKAFEWLLARNTVRQGAAGESAADTGDVTAGAPPGAAVTVEDAPAETAGPEGGVAE